ncbi:hypothetical protein Tco_1010635 [Tanacetum coccineum]
MPSSCCILVLQPWLCQLVSKPSESRTEAALLALLQPNFHHQGLELSLWVPTERGNMQASSSGDLSDLTFITPPFLHIAAEANLGHLEALVLKGGDGGACKLLGRLLGDVIEVLGC